MKPFRVALISLLFDVIFITHQLRCHQLTTWQTIGLVYRFRSLCDITRLFAIFIRTVYDFHARHEVTSFMTSLKFLLFALRVTFNVLWFRNEQASLCYFYFVFIIVIKKITDPQNSQFFCPTPTLYNWVQYCGRPYTIQHRKVPIIFPFEAFVLHIIIIARILLSIVEGTCGLVCMCMYRVAQMKISLG